MGLLLCVMFNILSQITLKVKFLGNKEQHHLLPSLVDVFTCVHSENALLTHILSTLFSSTSVIFSCTPFGIYISLVIVFTLASSQDRCSQFSEVEWDVLSQALGGLRIFQHFPPDTNMKRVPTQPSLQYKQIETKDSIKN